MRTPDGAPELARSLLADAARWRLFSLFFLYPSGERQIEIASLSEELGDPGWRHLVGEAIRFSEGDYLALLGPGGTVSPREAGYRPLHDPGRILADLAAFYSAFAYSPGSENPNDHIASELGFMGFLRLKQAYAQMRVHETARLLAAQALDLFVEDHLGDFSVALSGKLSRLGPPWLAEAARQIKQQTQWLRELVPLSELSAGGRLNHRRTVQEDVS